MAPFGRAAWASPESDEFDSPVFAKSYSGIGANYLDQTRFIKKSNRFSKNISREQLRDYIQSVPENTNF